MTASKVTTPNAVVLLSGGMDSVAALHWALARYTSVRAIGFDYGQPHRDAELTIAGQVARALSVPYAVLVIADAMNLKLGLLGEVRDHDDSRIGGLNPAFVPNRNAIFLNIAAPHACAWFPNGNIDLVVACNADDAQGFADCRPAYLREQATLLRKGCARQIDIAAPWVGLSKGGIIAALHENPVAIEHIRRSWSCYRGQKSGPCGTCTACVVRARAFETASLGDLSTHPQMIGGDPARETALA